MVNNPISRDTYYDLDEIHELVRQDRIFTPNRRASNRIEDLGWDSGELKAFILAIEKRHFKKRFPDCDVTGNRKANCDGYRIRYDEESQSSDDLSELDIFVKLAISPDQVLVVSFHLEGSPG